MIYIYLAQQFICEINGYVQAESFKFSYMLLVNYCLY